MKRYFILIFTFIITGCGGGVPHLKLLCESPKEGKVLFETDRNTNSLIGDDGTSTKFYQDNLVEVVFVNFDESGNPTRVVNYYPTDPGLEIIEGDDNTGWMCEHVN